MQLVNSEFTVSTSDTLARTHFTFYTKSKWGRGLERVQILKCPTFHREGYVTDGRKYHSIQHPPSPPQLQILLLERKKKFRKTLIYYLVTTHLYHIYKLWSCVWYNDEARNVISSRHQYSTSVFACVSRQTRCFSHQGRTRRVKHYKCRDSLETALCNFGLTLHNDLYCRVKPFPQWSKKKKEKKFNTNHKSFREAAQRISTRGDVGKFSFSNKEALEHTRGRVITGLDGVQTRH